MKRVSVVVVLFLAGSALPLLGANPNDLVVITGQSNADGFGARGALSTTASGDNCLMSGNTRDAGWWRSVGVPWGCVPGTLTESGWESPATSFANTWLSRTGRSVAVINMAHGGFDYTQLKNGSTQWGYGERLMRFWGAWAPQPDRIIGLLVIHGEADDNIGTSAASYRGFLEEWQSDFQTLVRNVSNNGASATVPIYIFQEANWTVYGHTTPTVAIGQYDAAKNNPGKIILIGPHYQHARSTGDSTHIASAGIRAMGAQAAYAMSVGPTFQPVWTTGAITRVVNRITATYNVPTPPLVLDTTTVANPGNYGFEVAGGGSITSVSLAANGHDVYIDVTGTVTRLRYAYTGVSGANSGPTTGARGCLRDSTSTGNVTPFFAVTMDEPVQ